MKSITKKDLMKELRRLKHRFADPNQTSAEIASLGGSIITVKKFLEKIQAKTK